jgi:hypothetical protein
MSMRGKSETDHISEASQARRLEELGVPVLYALGGEARAEGGDLLWLDYETLAVGQGFRTNAAGLHQLREVLTGIGVTVIPVELPYYSGPESCLHLLSLISIVAEHIAIVYPPLLSVPFCFELQLVMHLPYNGSTCSTDGGGSSRTRMATATGGSSHTSIHVTPRNSGRGSFFLAANRRRLAANTRE